MKFEIKPTEKYGLGAFATEDIKKGEVIFVMRGERILEESCDKMIEDGLLNNDDPLQISKDYYLILDNTSRYFNHSCDPNAGLKGESTLFALRDIPCGEEILFDYSTTVYPENFTFTTMHDCLCRSPKCRKVLGNVLTIPKDTLDYYKENGALQDYILKALREIK